MWTVIGDIEEALEILSLPASSLRRCGDKEAAEIFETAKQVFVEGNPRVWWLSLKISYQSFSYGERGGFEDLGRHIPNSEQMFWFIPETKEKAIVVFEVTTEAIIALLGECNFFEYNLVGNNFDWLIIENDHNEIIIAKTN